MTAKPTRKKEGGSDHDRDGHCAGVIHFLTMGLTEPIRTAYGSIQTRKRKIKNPSGDRKEWKDETHIQVCDPVRPTQSVACKQHWTMRTMVQPKIVLAGAGPHRAVREPECQRYGLW